MTTAINAITSGFFGAAGVAIFVWLNRKWIRDMVQKIIHKDEPAKVYEIGELKRSKKIR